MCLYWPGNHKTVHAGENKQPELVTWFFCSQLEVVFVLLICGSFVKLNDTDAFMYGGWHGEAARPDLQAHQNSHCSRGNSSESICAWSWFRNNLFATSPWRYTYSRALSPDEEWAVNSDPWKEGFALQNWCLTMNLCHNTLSRISRC